MRSTMQIITSEWPKVVTQPVEVDEIGRVM